MSENGYKNVTIISNPSKDFLNLVFRLKDPIRKEMKERNINLWIKLNRTQFHFLEVLTAQT